MSRNRKAYFVEILERIELLGSAKTMYTYNLRHYLGPKDILGTDQIFYQLSAARFKRIRKAAKFTITERRNRNNQSISNVLSKTVYQRQVKHLGNTALKKSGINKLNPNKT